MQWMLERQFRYRCTQMLPTAVPSNGRNGMTRMPLSSQQPRRVSVEPVASRKRGPHRTCTTAAKQKRRCELGSKKKRMWGLLLCRSCVCFFKKASSAFIKNPMISEVYPKTMCHTIFKEELDGSGWMKCTN
jgi:hypothetical protein